ADGDGAAFGAGSCRRMAAAVYRQHPRARRLHPADGPAFQGHHAVDRRILVRHRLGIDRDAGADPDAGGRGRGDRHGPGDAAAGRRAGELAMPGKPHIEVDGLEMRYGDVQAVRGVSFTVAPGEQLTLLGPSGCGKTTTLRAVAGLEQPTAGEIRIGGAPVYSSALRVNIPAEKRGLSMVFQSYAIWPHMTVFENVAYGLKVRRRPRAEIDKKVRSALDLVQMGAYATRHA